MLYSKRVGRQLLTTTNPTRSARSLVPYVADRGAVLPLFASVELVWNGGERGDVLVEEFGSTGLGAAEATHVFLACTLEPLAGSSFPSGVE